MIRKKTYNVINDYYLNDSFINLALKNLNASKEEMAQIAIRVYGILQNKEYIDYLIEKLTDRAKIKRDVYIIFQIAVYEYKFLGKRIDVCVNEAVKLASKKAPGAKGYINVILRKLSEIDNVEVNFKKEEKNLQIKYSHPRWIVKLLMSQYPDDYEEILKSNTKKKTTTVRKLKEIKNKTDFEKVQFPNVVSELYEYKAKSIVNNTDFIEKNIIIQDMGSYLVKEIVNPQKEEIILDLCAAPGMKTMHISTNAKMVVANEINKSRFELLNENLKQYNIQNVKTINADATSIDEIKKSLKEKNLPLKFDKILIDAPCSGLGVIKSKPEIKYNMNKEKIVEIIGIQSKILEAAVEFLKGNGQLIYSTCTLNKDENEEQIKTFLKSHKFIAIENKTLKNHFNVDEQIGITIKPYTYNSDGFYIVKLERNEK